eukprot:398155-Amphidinium_carterae.1
MAAFVAASTPKRRPRQGTSLETVAEERPEDFGQDLTADEALRTAECETLAEITQLLYRRKGLSSLHCPPTVDFGELVSLRVLSLSHNKLVDIKVHKQEATPSICSKRWCIKNITQLIRFASFCAIPFQQTSFRASHCDSRVQLGIALHAIHAVSELPSLIELNVNYNQIVDLSPAFQCSDLEVLLAANNSVEQLPDTSLQKLWRLSLFSNQIQQGLTQPVREPRSVT